MKVMKFVRHVLSAIALFQLLRFVTEKLTRSSRPPIESWYDEEVQFGISIGEYCKTCQKPLELHLGGFNGKPTNCPECLITEIREDKLKQLEI